MSPFLCLSFPISGEGEDQLTSSACEWTMHCFTNFPSWSSNEYWPTFLMRNLKPSQGHDSPKKVVELILIGQAHGNATFFPGRGPVGAKGCSLLQENLDELIASVLW